MLKILCVIDQLTQFNRIFSRKMADGIDDPPLDQLGNAQQDPPPQQNPAPAQDPPQVNQLPQHDLPPGAANATPNELRTIKLQMATQENNIPNTWGYFDGDLHRWLEFKQRFTRAIHENADISAVFKFLYLKKSLSGEPLELLKRFDVNDANYSAAWERLNQEYE